MRIEQLKYFLEVAKCHSIGIAAEKLFVTQPTISISLKNLEQELGIVLFTRSKNGVFLTELGQVILPKAIMIVEEENNIRKLSSQNESSSKEKFDDILKICAIPMIMYSCFKNAIIEFTRLYPRVQLLILEKNPQETIHAVENDGYDIGFLLANPIMIETYKAKSTLIVECLFTEKIFAVADSSFGLNSKSSLSIEELKYLPLVTTCFNIDDEDLLRNDVFDNETEMNIILKTNSIDLFKNHVLNGLAVGIVLNSMVVHVIDIDHIDIIPINLPFKAELCCVINKDNNKQSLINAFIPILMKYF